MNSKQRRRLESELSFKSVIGVADGCKDDDGEEYGIICCYIDLEERKKIIDKHMGNSKQNDHIN